jgi:hypothetical protein
MYCIKYVVGIILGWHVFCWWGVPILVWHWRAHPVGGPGSCIWNQLHSHKHYW